MRGEAGRPHFTRITSRQWGGHELQQQHQWAPKKSRGGLLRGALNQGTTIRVRQVTAGAASTTAALSPAGSPHTQPHRQLLLRPPQNHLATQHHPQALEGPGTRIYSPPHSHLHVPPRNTVRARTSSWGLTHHCQPRLLAQIPQLWQPESLLIIYCSFCSPGWCDPL